MEYLKGKWERHNAPNGEHIWCGDEHIADLDGNNANANARLIVEAVNACIKLNPDNPIAVAQSILDFYGACKALTAELRLHTTKWDLGMVQLISNSEQAIAKAEST